MIRETTKILFISLYITYFSIYCITDTDSPIYLYTDSTPSIFRPIINTTLINYTIDSLSPIYWIKDFSFPQINFSFITNKSSSLFRLLVFSILYYIFIVSNIFGHICSSRIYCIIDSAINSLFFIYFITGIWNIFYNRNHRYRSLFSQILCNKLFVSKMYYTFLFSIYCIIDCSSSRFIDY